MENKVSRLFVDTKDDSAKDKLLSVFIIDRTTKTIETLRKQFEATSICRLVGSSNKGTTATAQIKELHATTKIDVLVVDLDTHGALEAIQELSSKIPAIIATSIPEEDDPRLEEARAAGAKYYIERPFSAAELLVAVKETYKKNQSQDVKFGSDTQLTGNIITFLGAKGGVGTTTLALNMAGLLALRSQKFISLVDGDLQSGECANLLGIKKGHPTIVDLCDDQHLWDAKTLNSFLIDIPESFHLLASAPRPELSNLITPAKFQKILLELRHQSDLVLVDCPSHLTEQTEEVLERSSLIFLVTDGTGLCLERTKALIDLLTLRLLLPKENLIILQNSTHGEPSPALKTLQSLFGQIPIFTFPFESETLQLSNQSHNLLIWDLKTSGSSLRQSFNTLVDALFPQEIKTETPPVAVAPTPKKRGLFKR